MGLRLANLAPIDWERTLANRSERFSLEVRTSSGIWMRDIAIICLLTTTEEWSYIGWSEAAQMKQSSVAHE